MVPAALENLWLVVISGFIPDWTPDTLSSGFLVGMEGPGAPACVQCALLILFP